MITMRSFKNFYNNTKKRFFKLNAFGMFLGAQNVRFCIFRIYVILKIIITISLLCLNSLFFLYLNDVQTIYIDNMFAHNFNIFFFIMLMGGVFFFRGLKRLVFVIKRNFLFFNIILFCVIAYFCFLDDTAYDAEILIIPSIGFTLLKTTWTKTQLGNFFEHFEKEIEYVFSDDEKFFLIKKSLNPKDLEQKMLEKAATAHNFISETEDSFFFELALLGCLFAGIALFSVCVYFCMKTTVEVEDIKTAVEVFSNATKESNTFDNFLKVTVKITKIIIETFS